MLTFEEFFRKKKIDLVQLEMAEPTLFAEFKSEFAQMGEKSFDHSKKFLFNKLRRSYHTKDEPKPAKTVVEKNELATQAENLESPTIDQTSIKKEEPETQAKPAFKPRFKPGIANVQAPATEETVSDTEIPAKPVDFTPRFKTKPAEATEKPVEKPVADEQPAANKPAGFTPRFKAAQKKEEQERLPPTEIDHNTSESDKTQVTSVAEQEKDKDAGSDSAESPKPAYKPKFNMKSIKPKIEDASRNEEEQLEKPADTRQSNPESKPSYKPKFNLKTTIKQPDDLSAEDKSLEQQPAKNIPAPPTTETTVPPAGTGREKPAYKPRFNMKNIKPKQDDE